MKKLKITLLFIFCFSLLFTEIAIAQKEYKPIVKKSVFFGKSKAVREMKIVLPGKHPEKQRAIRNFSSGKKELKQGRTGSPAPKPALQRYQGALKSRGPLLNFEGVGNVNGVYPADPNGDVSADYYIQSVNMSFAVWDKSGNLVYGPVDNKTLWDGFPGPWNNYIWWSDPVFKYDRMADRWVISSMAINNSWTNYYTMVAVSESSDPLGAYNCYGYSFNNKMNDYPKLSIWPNGYYITYNIFEDDGWTFLYALATALDRDAMLAGEPVATAIEFQIPEQDSEIFFPLPADFYGEDIPADLPCYIVNTENPDSVNPWNLSLGIYAFLPDWVTPENSTFEKLSQFEIGEIEPVINFGPGAPQPGNDKNVITIPAYMMYPLSYRAFDDHESMVCCHTLWADSIHYLKWYELRKEDAGWYIYQTGNYSPDNTHRYQPSININANGDIAMGYTVSDETIYPSVRMTGRRANDPPGVMTFQEIEMYKGLNCINTYQSEFDGNRWGDYAAMMVDPSNDTTFWFTNMYPKKTAGTGNWGTRIFSINLTEEVDAPYAYAGPDTTICGYEDFKLHGEADNFSSFTWETGGDGWFINNDQMNPTYLRGNNDLENGQVNLSLTVTGYEPGTVVSDTMTLFLNKLPQASAGPDDTLCVNESYACEGEVAFSNSYYWTSAGNGSFNDSTLLDAIYTPAMNDTALEEVTLILHAEPLFPCTQGDEDELYLYLAKLPLATAGPDDTLCVNESYACQGEVSFSNSYYWTSAGSGSFNDSTLLDAIYTPAMSDTALEEVVLTLHAEPLFPCTQEDEDDLHLKIVSCLGIQEFAKSIVLKVYPNPATGLVTVEANIPGNDELTVRVLTELGKTIFRGLFPCRDGRFVKQFDFGMLQPGFYYITVTNGAKTRTVKLIIQ